MIAVPRKRKSDPDYGITRDGKGYKLYYQRDGFDQTHRLKEVTSMAQAREKRDIFYANLRENFGAVVIGARTLGIFKRKPWFVQLDGKHVGDYDTEEQAIAGRDEYLNSKK